MKVWPASLIRELIPIVTPRMLPDGWSSISKSAIPVPVPVAAAGRVRAGELPTTRVARTIYRGPYEGLHEAWREFGERAERELGDRLQAEGLRPGSTLWERYVAGPESSPDPTDWRTELNRPLVRAEGS